MQKILLDTDIGGDIDDAVCLAYLLREPQCTQRPHGRNGFHAGCRRKRGNCQIRG